MYKLAIFDMDGTILNTLEDLKNSVNVALSENGFPKRTLEEVRNFVGNGSRKLIERSVPQGMSEEMQEKVLASFDADYSRHCAVFTKPYEGIPETIAALREHGIKTAVVSNKPDYGVQALCEQYFKGLFDFSIGVREGMRKKPAPDTVFEVLKYFHTSKEDAVFIGDSDVDVQTAIHAEVSCIGVSWGFRDKEVLQNAGATKIVDTTQELLEHILNDR